MKKFSQFVAVWLLLLPLAIAQQTRVYREGNNWAQEITGSLTTVKNLRVKVDVGSVRVEGGSSQGINYVIRNRAYTSSEDKARKEFDSYKISAYVKGDTAWIVADWQGESPHRFSGDFSVTVPRDMDWVKLETEGGSVSTTAISGRVEAQSGGGSIRLDDIGGAISGETGGGSIDVGTVGGDLSLHTGGGSIRVNSAKGKISAESGGGSVVVVSGLQGAVLETGGGSIQVERCNGRVKAGADRRSRPDRSAARSFGAHGSGGAPGTARQDRGDPARRRRCGTASAGRPDAERAVTDRAIRAAPFGRRRRRCGTWFR